MLNILSNTMAIATRTDRAASGRATIHDDRFSAADKRRRDKSLHELKAMKLRRHFG